MEREKSRRYSRRSRSQWARLVSEQRESGLSQRAFCERRGLSISSFTHWRRRLQVDGDEGINETGFIELALDPTQVEAWDVELTLGAGVVLRVRRR